MISPSTGTDGGLPERTTEGLHLIGSSEIVAGVVDPGTTSGFHTTGSTGEGGGVFGPGIVFPAGLILFILLTSPFTLVTSNA